jgi:hypothetical protein
MTTMPSLREVMSGPFTKWLGDGDWSPWKSFLSALLAEPMTEAEMAIYRRCTGRETPPATRCDEAWAVVGRRGRKSATAAVLGCYLAVYGTWPRAPGETVRIVIVAMSKDQAKYVLDFAQEILNSHPALRRLIKTADSESVTLTNGIKIQCVANNFRSIRGSTIVCAIFDEVARWYDDRYANPDREVLRSVKPSMLTVPGSLLLGISSPWARRGLLFEKYDRHSGKNDSEVLVWKADTATMNPQVDTAKIAAEYADDPISAASEYGAEFRSDLEAFLSREAITACVAQGIRERPPQAGTSYVGFVDPSGGSRDSFCGAVAHADKDRAILDAIREFKPPFSPDAVAAELCEFFKSYNITAVRGDHYGSILTRELFTKRHVAYKVSDRSKSDLYMAILPAINSHLVDLLDNATLLTQLVLLERSSARSGKDSVDHPTGAHDDVANAAAGALSVALVRRTRSELTYVPGIAGKLYQEGIQVTGVDRINGLPLNHILPENPDYPEAQRRLEAKRLAAEERFNRKPGEPQPRSVYSTFCSKLVGGGY